MGWLRKADILLQTLDARDPQYCRCAELEAWATQKLRSKRRDHGIGKVLGRWVCDGVGAFRYAIAFDLFLTDTAQLRNQKRLIFVLTKVDLVIPQQVADWQQALGQLAPALCVQVSGLEFALETKILQTVLWYEL